MPKINVLPRSVAELIAAGEVVERPASVIKELCENSIDAKAKSITVEIRGGGLTFLRVTDNGCGISRNDVPLAFVSHATSKVSSAEDLDSIFTLGFRGEALASIASVSHVELLTRTQEEDIGTRCCMDGGEQTALDDAGCPLGTTIVVRDLFYNTPARMKFLKRDVTEATAVAGVVDVLAMSHPDVSFRFIRDGKQALLTAGDGNLVSATRSVLGKEVSASMLPVQYELDGVSVYGLVSKPAASRASRAMQFFYVNNRFVKTRTAMAALEQAYKGTVMVGKFPACVLYISLNARTVDANVHPAKTEVRFSDERKVFNAVYYAVRSTVNSLDTERPQADLTRSMGQAMRRSAASQMKMSEPLAKKANTFWRQMSEGAQTDEVKIDVVDFTEETETAPQNKANKSFIFDYQLKVEQKDIPIDEKKASPDSTDSDSQSDNTSSVSEESKIAVTAGVSSHESTVPPASEDNSFSQASESQNQFVEGIETDNAPESLPDICTDTGVSQTNVTTTIVDEKNAEVPATVIGEAFRTYIIVQQGDKLIFIDKHAAHERILYEQLKNKIDGSTQVLLTPVTVTLAKREYAAAIENLSLLREAGYDVDDFGSGTLIVRECPMYIGFDEVENAIIEMSSYLAEGKTSIETEKLAFLLHNSACRAAVKAGDETPFEELCAFANQVLSRNDVRYCPHGRPVCFEVTRREIEKQFGRLQ